MTNEDEMIAPSHSQPFGPKTGEMGASEVWGLNQMVWISLWGSLVEGGSFSRVTKASSWSWRLEMGELVAEIGRRRSSIVRSAEVLKALMRTMRGVGEVRVVLMKMSFLIMEMNGVMPLPPLTSTRVSCLQRVDLGNSTYCIKEILEKG